MWSLRPHWPCYRSSCCPVFTRPKPSLHWAETGRPLLYKRAQHQLAVLPPSTSPQHRHLQLTRETVMIYKQPSLNCFIHFYFSENSYFHRNLKIIIIVTKLKTSTLWRQILKNRIFGHFFLIYKVVFLGAMHSASGFFLLCVMIFCQWRLQWEKYVLSLCTTTTCKFLTDDQLYGKELNISYLASTSTIALSLPNYPYWPRHDIHIHD